MKLTGVAWVSALLLAALVFVACGGGSSHPTAAPAPTSTTTAAPPEDAKVTAKDFTNVNDMTRVDDHFVSNVNGHLAEALRVARSKAGGTYPVGTILQLFPLEAMVKRRAGFSPATDDWEFFTLDATKAGTKITSRGGAEVVNHFGHQSCAACHRAAAKQFDFVCGQTHGCAPLPVSASIFTFLQKTDPRPRK